MTQIREPAVAGLFYPAGTGELDKSVRAMLHGVQSSQDPAPKALIVPHAGYVYSGPVASIAYARLRRFRDHYSRVVLLGPSHRVSTPGLAVSAADAFRTPLGDVPLDREVIARLEDPPAIIRSEEPHRFEHSIEVQLPFLQTVLGSFSLVPLLVGDAGAGTVAEVIETLWGGKETLIVVSSDLSHFHDYEAAQSLDFATCSSIEHLDVQGIGARDACGSKAIKGLLLVARRRGLRITTLDLRNSGDTAGERDQVVGYGSWVLQENGPCR